MRQLGGARAVLEFSEGRIGAFLATCSKLAGSEFPYQDSRAALQLIEEHFKRQLDRLRAVSDSSDTPEVIRQVSEVALRDLFNYMPLLGFILRSTNVRNAFEGLRPLRRLAQDLFAHNDQEGAFKVHLLISSEWDYSPFTYHHIPVLRDFVLIGLPASESDNPLLLPIAGHELGHLVWRRLKLGELVRSLAIPILTEEIKGRFEEFKAVFQKPDAEPADLDRNIYLMSAWSPAEDWCLAQSQELFCDLLGLRVFGSSFLHAFAYLLAPGSSSSVDRYPSTKFRSETLRVQSDQWGIDCPGDYEECFHDPREPRRKPSDRFLLEICTSTLTRLRESLAELANRCVSSSRLSEAPAAEVERVLESYRLVVPAQGVDGAVPILNAAWKAMRDPEFWAEEPVLRSRKPEALRELTLKNLEILDYEYLTREMA